MTTDNADRAADPTARATLARHLGSFAGRRVLCVGDLMEDRFIYGEVKRISPEAPVPVLRITREAKALGGAGNVVRNLSALGAACSFVAIIGDDRAGREVTELLASMPAVEPYLRVARNRETTIKNRFFSLDGHHLLRADRETTTPVEPQNADHLAEAAIEQIEGSDIVVLSDYAKGIFGATLAGRIISAARRLQRPVIVDPKSVDYGRYAGASVITPNRAELAEATGLSVDGDDAIVAAARKLMADTNIGAVVVTRSADGMTVVTAAGDAVHLPAESREISDVTGAGDTVVAVIAVALAAGVPLVEAAQLANVAAGIVVARHGTAVASVQDIGQTLLHRERAIAESKCVDSSTAVARLDDWRRRGLKIGYTNGCFDLLHPGHVALLAQARAACDRLVVGLNSDASVRRLKGEGRPVQSETARATVMASIGHVDLVVIFEEDTPLKQIETFKPDVLVKGADYSRATVVGADVVERHGGRVLLADLVPKFSTTATIAALKRSGG